MDASCYGNSFYGGEYYLSGWLVAISVNVRLTVVQIQSCVPQGSLFIIYDASKDIQRRSKLVNQLLITLSVFDVIGSLAYALTTLPIPETDYIYGSKGNENTCTAQGFFIQIGTIACFLNVSLSFYYMLTVVYGWSEDRCKANRVFFFVPPIMVGLVFAFAGTKKKKIYLQYRYIRVT